jgi:hypothetical protein
MRLYIAGPMSGLPDLNYPAFHEAEQELRAHGFDVSNPARNEIEHPDADNAWQQYMRASLRQISMVEGIATLPDWERSRGAALEVYLATHLGLVIHTVTDWYRSAPRWSS